MSLNRCRIAAAGLLTLFLARAASASPSPCPGESTVGFEVCLSWKLDLARSDLRRYVVVAIRQIRRGDNPGEALAYFRRSQAAWSRYEEAECDAVYKTSSPGTSSAPLSLRCALMLTEAHTHEIWSNWLTSWPFRLPEPIARSGR